MEESDKLLLQLYNNLGNDRACLSQRTVDYCEALKSNDPATPAKRKNPPARRR
jgi:hypothetical protein